MSRATRFTLAAIVIVACLCLAPSSVLADEPVITPEGYTPPPIKIAIVRSQTTLDWLDRRRTPSRYPHGGKEFDTLAYLKGRGYNVTEIVGDRDLLNQELLKQYDVVVLPQVFAMSRKASMSVVKYVADGGGIVALGATPRAAPEYANRPGTRNDMREWWWRMYDSNVWEWGPMSQIYQTKMVNDAWNLVYRLNPNTRSSIITSATAILQARGYPGGAAVSLLRDPEGPLELTQLRKRRSQVENIANFEILNRKIRRQYRATYSAASATRYYKGKSVHFFFGVNEIIKSYSLRLWGIKTSTGIPQGEVAGAWMEAAIQWAAVKDGVQGPTTERVSARANARATAGGISGRIYLRNRSYLITYGTLRMSIRTASGRLVKTFKRSRIVTVPGTSKSYRFNWRRGLGRGQYRLDVSYTAGYPASSRLATSTGVVSRGHSVSTQ